MSEAMALVGDETARAEPGSEPTAPAPVADKAERFIRVDRHELIAHLIENGPWLRAERSIAQDVLQSLARLRQLRSVEALDRLMYAYDALNPDDETLNTRPRSPEETLESQQVFLAELRSLVEAANFKEIDVAALDSLLTQTSPYGVAVHVDREDFDTLKLYYRGVSLVTERKRDWRFAYIRHRSFEVKTFDRLFLALKLKPEDVRAAELQAKDGRISPAKAEARIRKMRRRLPKGSSTDYVYLKLFKRIPQADLDMLFPNTQIRLSMMDKVRLGFTAGGSTLLGIITFATKVVTAALLTPIAIVLALSGLFGIIFRQVMNVFNTRNKYMMTLAQNLYFHNLANNQGVIALLIDEAEEEDIKEAALLYTFLAKASESHSRAEVAHAVESFLAREFGIGAPFTFDMDDAAEKLVAAGLATVDARGKLTALPLGEAQWNLSRAWILERDRRSTVMTAPVRR